MRRNRVAVVTGVSTVMLGAGWAAGIIAAAQNAPAVLDASGSSTGTAGQVATTPDTQTSATSGASASATDKSTGAASATASATSEAPQTTTAVSGTFDGAAVNTRYGAYQAEIVVTDGVITAVNVLQDGNGDRETKRINQNAIPTLVSRVLTAQSWNVDGVSGASYTSPALLTSVKDATSQAGLS